MMSSVKEPSSSSSSGAYEPQSHSAAAMTQKTITNGTSYAKVVLRLSDDNENISTGGAENPVITNKSVMQDTEAVTSKPFAPRSSSHRGRFYPGGRGAIARKIPFQNQNGSSHPERENAGDVVPKDAMHSEPPDDFEVVVRKNRSSFGNSGPKFRKGRGDFFPMGRAREIENRRHIPRRYDKPASQDPQPQGVSMTQQNSKNHCTLSNGNGNEKQIENGLPPDGETNNGESTCKCNGTSESDVERSDKNVDACLCHQSSNGSACDKDENAEASKPQFVLAPPPKVNPWLAKSKVMSTIQVATTKDAAVAVNVNGQKTAQIQYNRTSAGWPINGNENHSARSSHPNSSPTNPNSYAQHAQSSFGKLPSGNLAMHNTTQSSSQTYQQVTQAWVKDVKPTWGASKGISKPEGKSKAFGDWPTLEQAAVSPLPVFKKPELGKLVSARSSVTETIDLGSEDIFRNTKRISVSDSNHSNEEGKGSHCSTSDKSDLISDDGPSGASSVSDGEGIVSVDAIPKLTHVASISSDETDGSIDQHRKTKRSSKQKWVPLSLPENPPPRVRRKPVPGACKSHSDSENRREPEVSDDMKWDFSGPRRGFPFRGRGSSRGGRGYYHRFNSRDDQSIHPAPTPAIDFTDYPADFTTLSTIYPVVVPEFIMPYVTPTFYPTTFTPPACAVVEDSQLKSGYVPVDASIVLDMLRKQIEYYFSHENLEKDFYMRRKMKPDGFLPISVIANFPRISNMTQDLSMVVNGIQLSNDLELSSDSNWVRTKHEPIKWPISDENSKELPSPKFVLHPTPISQVNHSVPFAEPSGSSIVARVEVNLSLTPLSTAIARSPVNEMLNPNVPEFVPMTKVPNNENKTNITIC